MLQLLFKICTLLIITIFSYGQELKTDKYCKKIDIERDKFEEKTKFRSPLLRQISFLKIVSQNESDIYIFLRTTGSTPSSGKGVILLLDNGQKIERSEETKVRVNSSANFEHSALFKLNRKEIDLLKNNNITDVRLYIYDMEIIEPTQYRAFLICLDEKY